MKDHFQNIVWSALTTRQEYLGKGDDLARRFHPEISPFAATRDGSSAALAALTRLIQRDEAVYLHQVDPIKLPPTLIAEKTALVVMMIQKTNQQTDTAWPSPVQLGEADFDEMFALADLTKPGPFMRRTPEIGSFWGIRIDGRLAAMAGTRLSFADYTEVSGVCTHPAFRGRGLASHMSVFVANQIRAAGDTPILHAYADNTGAISLYESLGFEICRTVNIAVVRRK